MELRLVALSQNDKALLLQQWNQLFLSLAGCIYSPSFALTFLRRLLGSQGHKNSEITWDRPKAFKAEYPPSIKVEVKGKKHALFNLGCAHPPFYFWKHSRKESETSMGFFWTNLSFPLSRIGFYFINPSRNKICHKTLWHHLQKTRGKALQMPLGSYKNRGHISVSAFSSTSSIEKLEPLT